MKAFLNLAQSIPVRTQPSFSASVGHSPLLLASHKGREQEGVPWLFTQEPEQEHLPKQGRPSHALLYTWRNSTGEWQQCLVQTDWGVSKHWEVCAPWTCAYLRVLHIGVIQAGAYLMVQGLKICLQGTHVQSLVRELRSHMQRGKPTHLEWPREATAKRSPHAAIREQPPLVTTGESPPSDRDPVLPKINLKQKVMQVKFWKIIMSHK